MKLIEVVDLINAIPVDDVEMVEFYTKLKDDLVIDINRDLLSKGLSPMEESEMLAIGAGF